MKQLAAIPTVGREINQKAALRLRASGLTYEAIGEELGVCQQTANRYVLEALAKLRAEAGEAAQEVRELESMRLDRLLNAVWPQAEAGDIKAIETVLKLMERRAKLRGLDQPERSMTVTVTSSREELEAEAARLGIPITQPPLTSQLPGLTLCPTSPEPSKSPGSSLSYPGMPDCSVISVMSSSTPPQLPGPSEPLPNSGNGISPEATLPGLMSWPGFDQAGMDPSPSGIPSPEDMIRQARLDGRLTTYSASHDGR